MTPHLQKQMMELAEAAAIDGDNYSEYTKLLYVKGFQAAIPLIRAECEGEIERLKNQVEMLTSNYSTKQILVSYGELSAEDKVKIDNLMKALKECK